MSKPILEEWRNTRLIEAVKSGDLGEVGKWLTSRRVIIKKAGAEAALGDYNIDAIDPSSGKTAFEIATATRNESVVRDLVEAGAIAIISTVPRRPPAISAKGGDDEVRGAETTPPTVTPVATPAIGLSGRGSSSRK
jgi:hypothetical protein